MMTGIKTGAVLRRLLSAGAASAALLTGLATAEDVSAEDGRGLSLQTGVVLSDYERRQIGLKTPLPASPIIRLRPAVEVDRPVYTGATAQIATTSASLNTYQLRQIEKASRTSTPVRKQTPAEPVKQRQTAPVVQSVQLAKASVPEQTQTQGVAVSIHKAPDKRPYIPSRIDAAATKPDYTRISGPAPSDPGDEPVSADHAMLARIELMLASQQAQIDAQEQRLAEQQQEILQQKSIIVEQQRQLISYANDVNTIGQQVAQVRQADQAGPAARDGALRGVKSRGRTVPGQPGGQVYLAQGQTPQAEASSSPPAQDAPERIPPQQDSLEAQTAARPQSEKQVDQLLLDTGGVLLPKGSFQLEPSFDYTAISSDRVNISGFSVFNAILIGTIRVDDLDRDILSTAVTGRYGITNRIQGEIRVPAVYRNDREVLGIGTGDVEERQTEGYGLGDVSATLSWQPISAKGWRPATIFKVGAEFPTGKSAFEIERIAPEEDSPERILAESPTGSGFYAISPGVTLVWPADPVVIFAGAGYTHTPARDFGGAFGTVDPGDGFEYFLGMNLSLNERTSTNFNFVNKRRFVSKQNNFDILGSGTNDARFGWGLSSGLNDRVSLVLNSTIGLTDESPDYTVSVRMPIKF